MAKAIRDGGIEATIDHQQGYMASRDVVDVYATNEPQGALHARVAFCLDIHNEVRGSHTAFCCTLFDSRVLQGALAQMTRHWESLCSSNGADEIFCTFSGLRGLVKRRCTNVKVTSECAALRF